MFPLLDRVLRIIERPLFYVAGFLVFLMMLHVVADVFLRYAFGRPITGTLEIVSNYYMVAVVFLPLAIVQRQNGHIKVEVFTSLLGPRLVAICDLFATAATLIYVGLMFWLVLHEAIEQTKILEKIVVGVSLFPVWPARWFVPIGTGAFLLAVFCSLKPHIIAAMGKYSSKSDETSSKWTD